MTAAMPITQPTTHPSSAAGVVQPVVAGVLSGSEHRSGRRRLLPGHLDIRVPARDPGLSQPRPRGVGTDRACDRPATVSSAAELPTNGGAWAPTIRHRDGTFYVVVTDAMGRGMLIFTATDPAGPWSDGTLVDGIHGIDPDLAWDSDGTAYITYSGLDTTSGERCRRPQGDPAGDRGPRLRKAAVRTDLAVVGNRPEIPRGAAPVPPRRLLVPHDRRGRHRARPRHQHRPRVRAVRAVRGRPRQSRRVRPQHVTARSRTPATATSCRHPMGAGRS